MCPTISTTRPEAANMDARVDITDIFAFQTRQTQRGPSWR